MFAVLRTFRISDQGNRGVGGSIFIAPIEFQNNARLAGDTCDFAHAVDDTIGSFPIAIGGQTRSFGPDEKRSTLIAFITEWWSRTCRSHGARHRRPARKLARVFAITTDPFIVLTSNVFAILGLRAVVPARRRHERFHLLSYGLAPVLLLIGAKMLIDICKISVAISVSVTAVILAASMIRSQLIPSAARHGTAYPFSRRKPQADGGR